MNKGGIALCIVAVAGIGTAVTMASTKTAPKDLYRTCLKIVAFGSSSTQGIGATSVDASYPSQVALALRDMMPKGQSVTMVNRGIGGEDSHAMMRRLKADVIERHPRLVIWQTGSNDPMTLNPVPRFEQETRDGIKLMREAGIEVVLMEPQWAPHLDKVPHASDYTEAVRRIGADLGVTVIRRSDIMKNWEQIHYLTRKDMMSKDNLHMSDKGYKALATCVAKEVMKTDAYKKLPNEAPPATTPAVAHL